MTIIITALCIWGIIALIKAAKNAKRKQKKHKRTALEQAKQKKEVERLLDEMHQQQEKAKDLTRKQIKIEAERIRHSHNQEQGKMKVLVESEARQMSFATRGESERDILVRKESESKTHNEAVSYQRDIKHSEGESLSNTHKIS